MPTSAELAASFYAAHEAARRALADRLRKLRDEGRLGWWDAQWFFPSAPLRIASRAGGPGSSVRISLVEAQDRDAPLPPGAVRWEITDAIRVVARGEGGQTC